MRTYAFIFFFFIIVALSRATTETEESEDTEVAVRKFPEHSWILEKISGGMKYVDDALDNTVGKDAARAIGGPFKRIRLWILPAMMKLGFIATITFMTLLMASKAAFAGLFVFLVQLVSIFLNLKVLTHLKEPVLVSPSVPVPLPVPAHSPFHKEVHVHVHKPGFDQEALLSPAPTLSGDVWSRASQDDIMENPQLVHYLSRGGDVSNGYSSYTTTG